MHLAYVMNDAAFAMAGPGRMAAGAARAMIAAGAHPFGWTGLERVVDAGLEMYERATRRYAKPAFGLSSAVVDGRPVAVTEVRTVRSPFLSTIEFVRDLPPGRAPDPTILVVAPMSGHYATLLRGTAEALLPEHRVVITDWSDAGETPLIAGRFDLDDYVDHLVSLFRDLGPDLHVLAVCQPSVPVAAAVALMEADGDPLAPASMTLMGGPVDTRRSPTAVNRLAKERGKAWFAENCITTVPLWRAGAMRRVYPGFLQLSGFMAMNMDRHVAAHREMFEHLCRGDGESAGRHRRFYDEYMAVMDLTAEFYLQTVGTVFVDHALPRGEMAVRGRRVDMGAIRRCAIMAVEGEEDDISGVGQTLAALDLATGLSDDLKRYRLQPGVGHYGVFNGSRFRAEIAPAIAGFVREVEAVRAPRHRAA